MAYIRVQEWLQVLRGLADDAPTVLSGSEGSAAIAAAADCICGLVLGHGTGGDGTEISDDEHRYGLLQVCFSRMLSSSVFSDEYYTRRQDLYHLGELGRVAAVERAAQLGDFRTRIRHWLQVRDPVKLSSELSNYLLFVQSDRSQIRQDENAAADLGGAEHCTFLLRLCDAYHELATAPVEQLGSGFVAPKELERAKAASVSVQLVLVSCQPCSLSQR